MSTTHGFIISGGDENQRFEAISSIIDSFPKHSTNLNNPDVVIIKAEESTIGIDQIRNFQIQLNISPTVQKNKVGVIMEAEKLTLEAQNSLLKTLEEPPLNTSIFLLCPDEGFFIPTILSRCQTLNLPQQIENLDGNQLIEFKDALEITIGHSISDKFKLAAEIAKDRPTALKWLKTFTVFLHQSLLNENQNVAVQANFPVLFHQISEAKKRLKSNSNVRLTIENLLLNW